MVKRPIIFFSILFFFVVTKKLSAQENLNIQSYTPSILLKKNQWEFKHFNNVYTQTKRFKQDNTDTRETWFTSINQFLFGLTPRLNFGFDIWVKSFRREEDKRVSPIWVLKFENITTSRTAITGIGPKLKITPWKRISHLSWQSTFLIPTGDALEGNATKPEVFLEHDRKLWINELFFDKALNSQWQLFTRISVWTSFVRASFRSKNYIESPISIFLSHFYNQNITLYLQTEYWPTHYDNTLQKTSGFNNYFVHSGFGCKYQLVPSFLEAEFSYSNFWLGSEGNGAGQTFNLGIRIISN